MLNNFVAELDRIYNNYSNYSRHSKSLLVPPPKVRQAQLNPCQSVEFGSVQRKNTIIKTEVLIDHQVYLINAWHGDNMLGAVPL